MITFGYAVKGSDLVKTPVEGTVAEWTAKAIETVRTRQARYAVVSVNGKAVAQFAICAVGDTVVEYTKRGEEQVCSID